MQNLLLNQAMLSYVGHIRFTNTKNGIIKEISLIHHVISSCGTDYIDVIWIVAYKSSSLFVIGMVWSMGTTSIISYTFSL
jgi:hypothetical protein